MSKPSEQVITNFVNSIFMKKAIKEKGWSRQDAIYATVEFLTCGKAISVKEFFANFQIKPVTIQ